MTKKLNVVFFGTPDIGLKSLEHLYKSENFNIQAVVTQPDRPSGRGHKACTRQGSEVRQTRNRAARKLHRGNRAAEIGAH